MCTRCLRPRTKIERLDYRSVLIFTSESNLELVNHSVLKEEKVYSGTAETFGKQWQVGDVVGVFLDLIDRTISKTEFLSERFSCHISSYTHTI